MGIPDPLTCLLSTLYAGQEATVRTGHGTAVWVPNSERSYNKAVYCHSGYLTYMQNTSCEMLGWMNHKWGLRLLGKISTTSDIHMIPL